MRLLMVVQSYFPFQERGGPVVKVRALAHALSGLDHQITVLTADLGLKKYVDAGLAAEKTSSGWRARENGVEAIYLPTLAHYRDITLNPNVIGFSRAALRDFQLVHFFGLYDTIGPVVSGFCRRYNIPYVVEPMGMYRPIDRGFKLKRLWHRNLGDSYLKRSAFLIATSEMEQRELVEDGVPADKVVIRYNGVDRDAPATQPTRGSFRAQYGISPDEPLILFLSRLIPRKGADILIDAFARVCPDSGFLVIAGPDGDAAYVAGLKKRAADLGVASRVLFTGALYDTAKAAALEDATVFALPSRYENFANVAAEAMAHSVPVIISDACGIRSLVENRAGLVVAPELEPLAAALSMLLSDRTLYARFKEGSRGVTAELRWDSLAQKMTGYYEQAIAANGRQQTSSENIGTYAP
jgi:glycosyltransferase involved in cell wall biosynthesis